MMTRSAADLVDAASDRSVGRLRDASTNFNLASDSLLDAGEAFSDLMDQAEAACP